MAAVLAGRLGCTRAPLLVVDQLRLGLVGTRQELVVECGPARVRKERASRGAVSLWSDNVFGMFSDPMPG